ncbi:MAG: hypothetical protein KA221_04665 [Vitreoscilla sp.]|nr:hypothetical protein [Vitreoscilla sp.]MBP9539955.1 hypothetical protein [Vitreoscilla sp.]
MVNLYQLLGLDRHAAPEAIQAAIAREQALGNINPEVLEKASAWLLDAPTRARYDAQLRGSDANETSAPIPDLELSPRHTTPNLMTAKPASIQQPQPSAAPQFSAQAAHNHAESKPTAKPLPEGQELFTALIGESKADYYLIEFDDLAAGGKSHFNWAAFFGGSYWFAARGMWGMAIMILCVATVVLILAGILASAMGPAAWAVLAAWLLWRLLWLPLKANQTYFKFAQKRVKAMVRQYAKQPDRMLRLLRGTTNMGAAVGLFAGVCVMALPVMGILAAIALPMYADYVDKAVWKQAHTEMVALQGPIDAVLQKNQAVQTTDPKAVGYVDISGVTKLREIETDFDVVGEGYVMGRSQKNYNLQMHLVRDSVGLWHCEMHTSGDNAIPRRDIPAVCKIVE